MIIKKILASCLLAASIIGTAAEAQDRTPVINSEKGNQERRINKGIRKGQLTRNEARTLRHNVNRISAEKRMAAADGHISPTERRKLRKMEHANSRLIYKKRHNQ